MNRSELVLKKVLFYSSLLFILILAACGGGDAPAGNSDAAASDNTDTSGGNVAAQSAPMQTDNGDLVALVNGEPITREAFDRALARMQTESAITDPAAMERVVMDMLVEQALIRQAAQELNISVSQEDIDAEIQGLIEMAGGEAGWQEWLAVNMYTEQEYRDAIANSLLTQRVIDAITADLSGDVPQVHARHILLPTEADALEVLQLLQNGGDFAQLAMTYSVAADAQLGGDLGWFTRQGLLESSLADVAFSLQPNEIAGPVATRLGYHIVQTLEYAERPISEEDRAVLAQIEFENWLQTLRERATIERYR
ncbi:MAG: hypothetical protein D6712_20815 [Chloroflexi bacterium]|nr:MAG: hypothetical protein D6712_20815 [Chloroflexota bacterium]